MNDRTQTTQSGRRKWPLLIGAAVAVVTAGFVATYLIFFTDDSPERLRLSTPGTTAAAGTAPTGQTQAPTAAPATGGAVTGTWTVAANSTAGYRVREKLARLPAQSDAVGRTNAVKGSIQVNRSGNQLVVAEGARFEVDVTKLTSDESQRDNRIRTMGLESNRFPTATFVSTAPIQLPAGAETGQPVKTEATGDMTIHGVTKRVTIPLDAQISNGRVEVVGSLTFPFSDFRMSPPNIGGFVTVDNNATLEFQFFFDKQ